MGFRPANLRWGVCFVLVGSVVVVANAREASPNRPRDPLTPTTTWVETKKLLANDGASGDHFGWSVAISADTAIVGASTANVAGKTNAGAAYVFVRSGAAWSLQQKLVASDPTQDAGFGRSVALSGDTALVGSWGNAAAYAFVRAGTTWTQQQKLTPADAAIAFGQSVALEGDNAVVGAYGAILNGNANQGAAYVFARSGTTWTQTQKLVASDGAAGDYFGVSVALSGSTALVGAYRAQPGGVVGRGAAYAYTNSGATWTEQKLVANDGANDDRFGSAVALQNGTAVVAATNAAVGANAGQGAAYVFKSNAGAWTQAQKLTASNGAANDQFGYAVSMAGTTIAVGAPGALGTKGSAWTFDGAGGTFSQTQTIVASDGASSDEFGFAVATTGTTTIVGAAYALVGVSASVGAAYVEALLTSKGATCAADAECATGHCADGVCCNTACGGQCEVCNDLSSAGTCIPVTGAPRGSRPACVGTGTPCGGSCDGQTTTVCASFPGASTACGSPACAGATLTPSFCNGAGACVMGAPAACPNHFACNDAASCKIVCLADADCSDGFVCNSYDRTCVAKTGSACVDDHTSQDATGLRTDCGRFKCEQGSCRTTCGSVDDCVAPNVCDPSGQCMSQAARSGSSSGGCSAGGRGETGIGAAWLVAAAIAAAIRRRLTFGR